MFTIRKVKPEEIPAVKELLTLTWKNTYSCFLPEKIFQTITTNWHSPERLKIQAEDPAVYFALAEDENKKVVGLVTARKDEKNVLHISRLYVHPQEQSKGIGKSLLQSALDYFKDYVKTRIEVEEENTQALGFYKKMGFVEVGKKIERIRDAGCLNLLILER